MADKREQFSISTRYDSKYPDGCYIITQAVWCTFRPHVDQDGGYWSHHTWYGDPGEEMKGDPYAKEVWFRPCRPDDPEEGYPADVCAEYERLIEYDPEYDPGHQPTLGEMCFGGDDEDGSGYNQPCRFGDLAEGHAVYCNNSKWLYAPTKCRRTWYTGGERRDEDCPGFSPNPNYKEKAPIR